jgi:hypothetical protein
LVKVRGGEGKVQFNSIYFKFKIDPDTGWETTIGYRMSHRSKNKHSIPTGTSQGIHNIKQQKEHVNHLYNRTPPVYKKNAELNKLTVQYIIPFNIWGLLSWISVHIFLIWLPLL